MNLLHDAEPPARWFYHVDEPIEVRVWPYLRLRLVGHRPLFTMDSGVATIVHLFIVIKVGGKSLKLVGRRYHDGEYFGKPCGKSAHTPSSLRKEFD